MRLLPDRITGQLVALLLTIAAAVQGMGSVVWFALERDGSPGHPAETTGRIAGYVELLDAAPAPARPALLSQVAAAAPQLAMRSVPAAGTATVLPVPGGGESGRGLQGIVRRALRGRYPVGPCGRPADEHCIRVVLSDGETIEARQPPSWPGGPLPFPLLFEAAVLFLLLLVLGVWAAVGLTRPLRALSAAAESYTPTSGPVDFPAGGPREIRTLARALGRMQTRIAELLQERSNAFAALGHDLRTPITRLRLRADYMAEEAERQRMVADLDLMDRLVRHTLDHLRAESTEGGRLALDVSSLVQTVADRFEDMGCEIRCRLEGRVQILGDPVAIEQAVDNLVDNACKYGEAADIRLRRVGEEAVLEIADRGPGIAPADRARMLEPYVRGNAARTLGDREGFGLGLSIARRIVERHGGRLELDDAEPHGLLVRVRLPAGPPG